MRLQSNAHYPEATIVHRGKNLSNQDKYFVRTHKPQLIVQKHIHHKHIQKRRRTRKTKGKEFVQHEKFRNNINRSDQDRPKIKKKNSKVTKFFLKIRHVFC